ncbi:MAG: YwmB family TATA-box binding protein [Clostridia bacterium]|nr:YwmB family TATA-box binding protein [Clostridia bacterium]
MKKNLKVVLPILIVFITVSLVLYQKLNYKIDSPETTLLKSFSFSGAKIINSEIYFWGELGEECTSIEKVKPLVEDFASSLNIIRDNSFTNETIKNDITEKIQLKGITNDKLLVNISAQLDTNGNPAERFISVSVTEDLPQPNLEEIKQKVLSVFDKYRITPKVNSCITGNYNGQLNYQELNNICRRIFEGVEAKKVEGIRDKNLISVSAYSPFIEDSIEVKGNKVNLNLAIRYNSYEDKTYIWVATPVITTEY